MKNLQDITTAIGLLISVLFYYFLFRTLNDIMNLHYLFIGKLGYAILITAVDFYIHKKGGN